MGGATRMSGSPHHKMRPASYRMLFTTHYTSRQEAKYVIQQIGRHNLAPHARIQKPWEFESLATNPSYNESDVSVISVHQEVRNGEIKAVVRSTDACARARGVRVPMAGTQEAAIPRTIGSISTSMTSFTSVPISL